MYNSSGGGNSNTFRSHQIYNLLLFYPDPLNGRSWASLHLEEEYYHVSNIFHESFVATIGLPPNIPDVRPPGNFYRLVIPMLKVFCEKFSLRKICPF